MLNPVQLRYLMGEAFRALGRRRLQHAVAILIMSFSLLFLAVFALITLNVQRLFTEARSGLVVRVYLEEGISEDATHALQRKLLDIKGVGQVNYVSKEEALEVFRRSWEKEAALIDALETNPLPASFELEVATPLRSAERLGNLAAGIAPLEGVDRVAYGEELLGKLERWLQIFLMVDVIVGFIVIASSVFVVSNTVRLTVLSRAKTIEILKMVGATNTFIRMPFMMEGMVQGVIASTLALILLRLAYAFVSRRVDGLLFLDWTAVLVFVLFCGSMGMLGSLTSVKRFLKI